MLVIFGNGNVSYSQFKNFPQRTQQNFELPRLLWATDTHTKYQDENLAFNLIPNSLYTMGDQGISRLIVHHKTK